jgi:hypothetical protein
MRQPKKHYKILLNGRPYGESWAVSAKKAIANVWWKRQKQGDRYRDTNYRISDFDAVEMED